MSVVVALGEQSLHGEPFCPDQHLMGERVTPNLGKTQLLNQNSLSL